MCFWRRFSLACSGLLRHFRKEIESRCREEPLIKKKINNPYLVDQHLLENKMPKITISVDQPNMDYFIFLYKWFLYILHQNVQ